MICRNQLISKCFCKGSYFGPQLVEEHGANKLNQIQTSRFEIRSQPEPMMPDIDIDLGQPKVNS